MEATRDSECGIRNENEIRIPGSLESPGKEWGFARTRMRKDVKCSRLTIQVVGLRGSGSIDTIRQLMMRWTTHAHSLPDHGTRSEHRQ